MNTIEIKKETGWGRFTRRVKSFFNIPFLLADYGMKLIPKRFQTAMRITVDAFVVAVFCGSVAVAMYKVTFLGIGFLSQSAAIKISLIEIGAFLLTVAFLTVRRWRTMR